MRYLTPKERLETKEELDLHYASMQSWAIREGKAMRWLENVDRDAKILECGCGPGYFARELVRAGFTNTYESDIYNFIAFDEVKKLDNFVQADLSYDRLPFEDGELDLVLAMQTLEHVENPWHAIREFKRVLKKGGRCIISIPRAEALAYRWSFLVHQSPDLRHMPDNNDVNFFIPDIVSKLFRESEWEREWTEYSSRNFIRLTSNRKLRLPDWLWLNKIFARRIGFSFKKK